MMNTNRYEDSPCNLIIAKKLKELGYDENVEYYWVDKDLSFVKRGLKRVGKFDPMNHNQSDDFIYSAPFVRDARRWLIENSYFGVLSILDNGRVKDVTDVTIRPCDCTDEAKAEQLDHRGIKHNDQGISVEFGKVKIEIGTMTVTVPVNRFKQWSEWFLVEQIIKDEN